MQLKIKVGVNRINQLLSGDILSHIYRRTIALSEINDFTTYFICLTILPITLLAYVFNIFVFKYDPPFGYPIDLLPGLLIGYIAVVNLKTKIPKTSNLLTGVHHALLYFIMMGIISAPAGITPFHQNLLSFKLLQADLSLGFKQINLINWTYHHPWLARSFRFMYVKWVPTMVSIPIILKLIKSHRMASLWLNSCLIAIFFTGVIFYFFPSLPPANVLASQYFPEACYSGISRFFAIQNHQPFISILQSGLIVFPSTHVIGCLINIYVFKDSKYLFPIMLIFNGIVILSTIFLGMHFLVDAFAGVLVAALSIWLAKQLNKN